jgi:hypothetical protein
MRHVTAAIVTGLLALALPGCAHKQQTVDVDAIFIKYDTDKNGVITKEEFAAHWRDKQKADTAWKKLDSAGNGSLSRAQAKDVPFDVWSELDAQAEP